MLSLVLNSTKQVLSWVLGLWLRRPVVNDHLVLAACDADRSRARFCFLLKGVSCRILLCLRCYNHV